ncbi:ABC transporter ATP-binding protein [Gottschalkiaceae bacterium SANA]|nr:ABC transporter ATP-binding protein [Gottschalkiaceae bacterium SANA]
MLKIDNLHAGYGGIKALRGVSIDVNEGEIVAVLGSNGAGKSTLLKTISGVMKQTEGSVQFDGEEMPRVPYQVVGKGIVHVPEGRQIFSNLTVYENLMIGSFLRKDKEQIEKDLIEVYELFPRLLERKDQYGGHLSGGEQQMLAVGRGLMANPKLMILDEPSLGLAPLIVNQIFEIVKEINRRGVAILIVEQNAMKALKICDRAYLMSTGVIEKSGKPEDLRNDPELMKAYLG